MCNSCYFILKNSLEPVINYWGAIIECEQVTPQMQHLTKTCGKNVRRKCGVCISYNTGKSALPDIYARGPRAHKAQVPVL